MGASVLDQGRSYPLGIQQPSGAAVSIFDYVGRHYSELAEGSSQSMLLMISVPLAQPEIWVAQLEP